MLKIIISPAKKMNLTQEYPCTLTTPVLLDHARELYNRLQDMELSSLKSLWGCSDRLALQNYERLHEFSPDRAESPALLSYEGIQYQHMAPSVFTDTQWDYVCRHLRILSGFYGILSPTDRVIPYRLEMQAKLKTSRGNDLYDFWGDRLYRQLMTEGMTELVNLASGEYSRAVLPYLAQDQRLRSTEASSVPCVTCIFGEFLNGKVKMKGTKAKIARGEMGRWRAEQQIERVEDMKEFHELGYRFRPELSRPEEYVFIETASRTTPL